MTTAPAAATALPPAVPPGPDHLDLTPLIGADGMTVAVVVLLVLVIGVLVAAAHAAVVRYRKGSR